MVRVGGVAQPDEGLDMQLVDAPPGEADGDANAAEGSWRIVAQAIVSHHDGA